MLKMMNTLKKTVMWRLDQYADEVMPDAVDTMIQLEADLARGK
jgi:hypothetical protein